MPRKPARKGDLQRGGVLPPPLRITDKKAAFNNPAATRLLNGLPSPRFDLEARSLYGFFVLKPFFPQTVKTLMFISSFSA